MRRLLAMTSVIAWCLCAHVGALFTDASDNFNRADNTTLGSNWTDTNAEWGICSNQACPVSSSVNPATLAYWNANSFGNDQFSQVTCEVFINEKCGLVVRLTGASTATQTGYALLSDGTTYDIYRIDTGGSATSIKSGSHTFAIGDVIRLEIAGTTITYKVNGSTIDTAIDATYGSGNPGIFSYNPVALNLRMDDWSGGPIAGGGATFPSAIINAPVRGGGIVHAFGK